MPINIELLKKVRDKIASTPEAYDQAVYGRPEPSAPCGTAACIAGWTVVLGEAMPATEVRKANTDHVVLNNIPTIAAELLDLDKDERETLFAGEPEGEYDEYNDERTGGWPEPFAEEWDNADTVKDKARVAVAYLDSIIATGEVL